MLTTSAEKADLRQWAYERGWKIIEPEMLLDCYEDFRAWQSKKIEDRGWPRVND
jgi:tRNA A22 N-methylase